MLLLLVLPAATEASLSLITTPRTPPSPSLLLQLLLLPGIN